MATFIAPDGTRLTYADTWKKAVARAQDLARNGAAWHPTKRSDVWWLDPVPKDPPSKKPSTYWVTWFPDGCFTCVCDAFEGGTPCAHIARVFLETWTSPKIWTENPTCTDPVLHDHGPDGYTKEALHLDDESTVPGRYTGLAATPAPVPKIGRCSAVDSTQPAPPPPQPNPVTGKPRAFLAFRRSIPGRLRAFLHQIRLPKVPIGL